MSVPHNLDEALSREWLTHALGTRFPGVTVAGVERGPVISRVATNARFRVKYEGQPPAGLSSALCVKGYFSDAGYEFRHAGEPEACFYRDILGMAGIRTLRSLYSEVDPSTRASVVISEDEIARGSEFLDASSPYTVDQVAESLTQLATLHAATWNHGGFSGQSWLAPRLDSYLILRGVTEVRSNFGSTVGAKVPDSARDADRLVAAYRKLARRVAESSTWTVVHGDAHIGNLFLDPDGHPCFTDWQLVQRGPWWLDVGYHIASALPVDVRRSAEADLVRHYLGELSARAIDVPSADEVRTGIRLGIVHGFFLWAITLRVNPAITAILLERLGSAAADHDALAELEK